jgi:hypothetical protein
MSTSISQLSSFTGLSETELARRAQDLVSTGRIRGLNALDAALVEAQAGGAGAADPFSAAAAASKQPHVLEEPATSLTKTAEKGFAAAPATASLQAANAPAVLDRAAQTGSQKIKGFGVFDMLGAQEAGLQQMVLAAQNGGDTASRELMFEQIKLQMQRISEAYQMISNTMSATNDQAKTAINNLKA